MPVPHDNRTGDLEYMDKYIFQNQFWQKVERTFAINVGKDLIKIGCLAFVTFKVYQTNGEWLLTKISFISQKMKPLLELTANSSL